MNGFLFYGLALLCAVLFTASDGARYALNHVSRIRLRQWAANAEEQGKAVQWFQRDKRRFSIVSATVVQLSIVFGLLVTTLALGQHLEIGKAFPRALLIWGVLVIAWKGVVAAMSEDGAERLLEIVTPILKGVWIVGFLLFLPIRAVLAWRESKYEENEEDVTEDEVRAFIDAGEEEGILEPEDRLLVRSVVAFGDLTVREVMTPRVDIVWVDADASFDELVSIHNSSKHTRIAVFEGDADHVVGFVHLKDVFAALIRGDEPPVRKVTRPALLVSENKEIDELLREFQAEQQQIAIVVDEFGGTAGLVSIEDLVEEIVGEIVDEHELGEEPVIELGDGALMVNGLIRLDQIEAMTQRKLHRNGDDFETVAGLIFKECGKVPLSGEKVERGGLVFVADRVDRKRIYRVKIYGAESEEMKEGES